MKFRTPLPALDDLAPGVIVQRCRFCGDLVVADELCGDAGEGADCLGPLHLEVDMTATRPVRLMAIYSKFET